jgi:hypothetical protein
MAGLKVMAGWSTRGTWAFGYTEESPSSHLLGAQGFSLEWRLMKGPCPAMAGQDSPRGGGT